MSNGGEVPRRAVLRGAAASLAAAAAMPGCSIEWPAAAAPRRRLNRADALAELAGAVKGRVLRPGASGYEGVRQPFNLRYGTRRPKAIVEPVSTEDVEAAIRWAREHGERLAARSGGHSYAAYSTPDNGVVIDLRRLRSVVPRSGGLVTVGAGAQTIDVHAALARRGLTLPTGTCPSVGIAGLALGGGMGLEGRRLGLTCDRLRGATIVTADGRRRRIDAGDEDLFWALRGGGGGNFGIVTSFTFRSAPGARASYFQMSWGAGQADAALAAWDRFAPETDPRLTSVLTITATGTGGVTVSALGQFGGSETDLRKLIRPLTGARSPSLRTGAAAQMDLVRRWAGCLERSVAECHTRGTRAGGRLDRARFAGASGYLGKQLSSAARAALIGVVGRRRGGGGALIIDAYGGAIATPGRDDTAFLHRDQRASVQAYASFGSDGVAEARRWLADVRGVLGTHGSGHAYQNYIDPDDDGWLRAAYGSHLARLREVARTYDPDAVLAFPQGLR